MKTLRKFAKCGFFAVLAAILSFVSCTDDSSYNGDIIVPEDVDLGGLEQYSYAIPIEIKSNTEWKIDFDGDGQSICYAYPKSGKGNATVKLCVLDNWTDVRRKGTMHVTFPNEPSKNMEIPLGQKCNLDPNPEIEGDNEAKTGDIVYGIGYGFNYLGTYPSPSAIRRCQILRIQELRDEGKIDLGALESTLSFRNYTGSSVEELTNKLNASASISGKYLGFKGEAGASFKTSSFNKSENEYAISYIEKSIRPISLNLDRNEVINYMTVSAYKAINGLNTTGTYGPIKTQYPTTIEGMKKLIADYGTHLIIKTVMGGRAKYCMTVDVSQVEGSYDLNAFAKCSYKNAFIDASGSVSDSLKASFKKNASACNIELTVEGGTPDAARKLFNGRDSSSADAWLKSLEDPENAVVVGMDFSTIIPLYDLVNTLLPGGEERQEFMKNFIEGKEGFEGLEEATAASLNIRMDYQTGETAKVELPSFSSHPDSTLVKDVYSTGQFVARVCEEYIPVINHDQRIKVVYPVLGKTVKYNLGMFVGDATHKPSKVCWEGNNLSVMECEDLPLGEMKEFYVRGSNVSGKYYGKIVNTTNRGSYMEGNAGIKVWPEEYAWQVSGRNYPLVKIFGKVWNREDFRGMLGSDGKHLVAISDFKYHEQSPNFTILYYPMQMAYKYPKFPPTGWRVASSEDFRIIESTLAPFKIPIGKAFVSNGLIGFDAPLNGYVQYDDYSRMETGRCSIYATSDQYYVQIEKMNDGYGFDITQKPNGQFTNAYYVSLRMVEDEKIK